MIKIDELNDYNSVIKWLFNQLANYQKDGGTAYKPGLNTIKRLLDAVDNPQGTYPTIHIAGTNGKGSVTHLIASIYQENGYKTGIYTSPHIIDFRERIKIDGQLIDEQFVIDYVLSNKNLIEELNATFFEITTAMAFLAFKKHDVDIAIIECGLGGRLDSTNVIHPVLSIITNISMDHAEFLGDTLEKIAAEKGGIIKENVPVLVGSDDNTIVEVLKNIADEKNAKSYYPNRKIVTTGHPEGFRDRNSQLARSAIQLLSPQFKVDINKMMKGLENVSKNTNFIGRFQLLGTDPLVVLDAAHNPDGVSSLLNEIKIYNFDTLHIIYGASNDKDLSAIFPILPKKATYYFTEFDSPRSTRQKDYHPIAEKFELAYSSYPSPSEALSKAKKNAQPTDLILIFGSFFMMEDILEMY